MCLLQLAWRKHCMVFLKSCEYVDQYAQLQPHQSSWCLVLKWTLKALWSWRVNMRAVPSRPAAVGLIPSTEEGDKRGSCTVKSWAWQHIPALSALWSMRQKDEIFKASLGYIPLKQQQNYSLFLIRHSSPTTMVSGVVPPFWGKRRVGGGEKPKDQTDSVLG